MHFAGSIIGFRTDLGTKAQSGKQKVLKAEGPAGGRGLFLKEE